MIPIVPVLNGLDMLLVRDKVLTAQVFGGIPGDFPWDRWCACAKQAGVPNNLVSLGRSVFREAFQHDWPDAAKVECGWLDGGQTMIFQALAFPKEAEARWSYLYSADNFGDAPYADEVSTEPMEIAAALEKQGIKTAVFVGHPPE